MWKWEADATPKAVIVIVHGAMEHHGRYSWLIANWRAEGYHVVMGDLPGQGMTSRSKRGHIHEFDEYIIEVKDWVQAAYQFDVPVFIVGHSLGGLVTMRMLQEHHLHIAGVILSSPCMGLLHYPAKLLSTMSFGFNVASPQLKFKIPFKIQDATRSEAAQELALNDTLYVNKVSVRWYRELIKAMKEVADKKDNTPDIPLLVMQAGADRVVDKASVQKWFNTLHLSDKQYKEWPNLYHELFNEPEREDVFFFAKSFVENQLRLLGYIID